MSCLEPMHEKEYNYLVQVDQRIFNGESLVHYFDLMSGVAGFLKLRIFTGFTSKCKP